VVRWGGGGNVEREGEQGEEEGESSGVCDHHDSWRFVELVAGDSWAIG
jgi:hypothetical protein